MIRGTLKVLGLIQPDRAGSLRTRSTWTTPDTIRASLKESPSLMVLTEVGPALQQADARHVHGALAAWAADHTNRTGSAPVLIIIAEPAHAERVLPSAFTSTILTTNAAEEVLA